MKRGRGRYREVREGEADEGGGKEIGEEGWGSGVGEGKAEGSKAGSW